jgi:methylisocitrate lyase
MLDSMQTRAELYQMIGYEEFESLDQSIARSILPPDLRDK